MPSALDAIVTLSSDRSRHVSRGDDVRQRVRPQIRREAGAEPDKAADGTAISISWKYHPRSSAYVQAGKALHATYAATGKKGDH